MANRIWRFAHFEFHETSLELRRDGRLVPAEAKAGEVLRYLLRNAVKAEFTYEDIKKGAWAGTSVTPSSVNVAIKKVRDAFGDENRESILRSVRGVGYAWAVEVVEVSESPRSPRSEFSVGQAVPGRQGWVLTHRLYADQHREVWLTGQSVVIQFAWEETGLGLLRAQDRVYSSLREDTAAAKFFSQVVGTQFDTAPYLLETEYLGLTLPAWAAQQHGLGNASESLRVGIAAATASALDALHCRGEVHGALSPDCIHLMQRGDEWIVRIDGFGHYVRESDSADSNYHRLPGAPNLQSPLFCAPELDGSGIATREGDIYALGVLLYQCVGCNLAEGPMLGWETRIPDAVLRTDISETANIDPALRTRKPADLARDLRDLAARRLAEEQLAESRRANEILERKLAVETANRPLRRALTATLALLAVVIVIAALLEIRSLQQERDKAREAKRDAQTLQRFFEKLFFDGDEIARGPLSAEALADRGLDKARVLEGVPKLHAAILNTLGTGFDVLGEYSKAETVLDQALEERRKAEGAESPEVAETLLQQASLKSDEGQPKVALRLAQKAFDLEKRTLPPGDLTISRTKTQMAEDLTELGEYDQAVSLLQQAVAQENGHPEMLAELSTALNDLGIAENYRGHLERSLDLQEQSMQIDRAMLGGQHPDIAEHLLSISNAHLLLGQTEQAVAEAKQALSILRDWLPAGHHEIAAARVMLADGLSRLAGESSAAKSELDPALQALRREPEHSLTEGHAFLVLGRLERQQGRLAEAIASEKQALSIYQTLYPNPHYTWTMPMTWLADLYVETAQWALAEPEAEQAWQVGESTLDTEDPRRLNAELVLAKVRAHQGRLSEAGSLLEDVLSHAPAGEPRTKDVREAALKESQLLSHKKA